MKVYKKPSIKKLNVKMGLTGGTIGIIWSVSTTST
jgi:hypothetical protein